MFAVTLNKGRAYDVRRNPVSQIERWGFVFELMPIGYHNKSYGPYTGDL